MSEQARPPGLGMPFQTGAAFGAFLRIPFDARGVQMMQLPMTGADVIIATFPKTGTTWTQQICHGLRSNGDMNFKEVSWVAPWLERGHMFGIDATTTQQFSPRVFKTHLEYTNVNKGARYIHVIRDPKDVLVSFYNFMGTGAIIDAQMMSIETFADAWLFADQLGERSDANATFGPHLYNYWQHLLDWWAVRDKAPVLYLAYEHMRGDLPKYVARIAEFMGINADQGLLARATHQATFEFMAANKDQFAERMPGTPVRFDKVVTGEVGSHRTKVSAALAARVDAAWQQYITPVLGFASYEAFIAGLA